MIDNDQLLDRLYSMRDDVRRVTRTCRVLTQQIARSIDDLEAITTSDSQEAHANDANRRTD